MWNTILDPLIIIYTGEMCRHLQLHTILSIFVALIVWEVNANAQKSGYFLMNITLITNSGDTIKTPVEFGNEFNMQYALTATDTSGNQVAIYSPQKIKQFYYVVNKDTITYVSKESPVGQIRVFMKLLYHDKIDLYQLITIDRKQSPMIYHVEYYLWENGWELPAITRDNQTEALLAHFSNCFQLQYKIKSHQYGLQQIKTIIREYEHCKLSSKYEFLDE